MNTQMKCEVQRVLRGTRVCHAPLMFTNPQKLIKSPYSRVFIDINLQQQIFPFPEVRGWSF